MAQPYAALNKERKTFWPSQKRRNRNYRYIFACLWGTKVGFNAYLILEILEIIEINFLILIIHVLNILEILFLIFELGSYFLLLEIKYDLIFQN